MIDHVTYHVSEDVLTSGDLGDFMGHLGFTEVIPDDPFEHGYQVRWFRTMTYVVPGTQHPLIHFVADDSGERDTLALGHFCVSIPKGLYGIATASKFCERNSGSGRAWLGFGGLRAEIRPR